MKRLRVAMLVALGVGALPAAGEEMDHASGGHGDGDSAVHAYLLFDQIEVRDSANPGTELGWDLRGWIGTDLTRLWLRSQGDLSSGHAEAADAEVLYGRSVSTWWDVVAGVRQDFDPGKPQTFGAIGIQGLAPQRIEVAATFYWGKSGQGAARVAAQYELLLTNRLVLQPHLEVDVYAKTDAIRDTGSGLSSVRAGLRLRYEITRQFAPYFGVNWDRAFGKTADLHRGASGSVSDLRLVAGVRAWF